MRELLFRLWLKDKMYVVDSIFFRYGRLVIRIESGFHVINYGMQDDVSHLMQWTGLTDKHGTKIFEGDIYKHGDSTLTVVLHEYAFLGYDQIADKHYALNKHHQEHYEVVYNIYEGLKSV